LFPRGNATVFPEYSESKLRIAARLRSIKSDLRHRKVTYNLGALYTLPHPFAIRACRTFLGQNPNHLGNWSLKSAQKSAATQQLEYEAIAKMIDLYHGKLNQLEGYLTSGGTEGNLFLAWTGRKYLEKRVKKERICLLRTDLTHYSVRKAADIIGVSDFIIPLSPRNWNIDAEGLENTINKLYRRGFKGFLLPLTLGYTLTGTCDNINLVVSVVQAVQRKRPDCVFFLWIDAALSGLIIPFLNSEFSPFFNKMIQGLVVDYHKFGLVPYPGGVVIYRRNLRHLIEKTIDYLPEKDNTVSGSRSGISAVAIWSMMHYFGSQGYKKLVKKCLANKRYFCSLVNEKLPGVKIITDPQSLTCGLVFKSAITLKNIVQKYGLYPTKKTFLFLPEKKEYVIYKLYFLPHLRRKIIDEFINDLMKYNQNQRSKSYEKPRASSC